MDAGQLTDNNGRKSDFRNVILIMTTNMTGLKQRKTFEEVMEFIQNDKTKVNYPDRKAKFLRNSFELSQLDGVGMMLLEQQQFREIKQREKERTRIEDSIN